MINSFSKLSIVHGINAKSCINQKNKRLSANSMKNILLLITTLLFNSCEGQNNNTTNQYTQKIEYGIEGELKEIITYVSKVYDNKLPLDTTGFFYKNAKTFDNDGNVVESNIQIRRNNTFQKIKRIFSGNGKNITFKEIIKLNNEIVQRAEYKYVWLDDYNYKIINTDDAEYYPLFITLNKDFKIIKSILKSRDSEFVENIETIYKNKRIEKIKTSSILNSEDHTTPIFNVEIMKEYDKHNNPTVVYRYENDRIQEVIFNTYNYY